MSRDKALMASTLIEGLTRLVEQHGDLPVSDIATIPVIHLC